MRLASSAVSVTTHAILIGAALWATAGAHPRAPQPQIIIVETGPRPINDADASIPRAPVIGGVTIPIVPLPTVDGGVGELPQFTFAPRSDSGPLLASPTPGSGGPIDAALAEEPPLMLAGPVPIYPDLLRQAGMRRRSRRCARRCSGPPGYAGRRCGFACGWRLTSWCETAGYRTAGYRE